MTSNERIEALTGLRGFAASLVVLSHLSEGTFPLLDHIFPGQVGVMVFFSLSGFLMSFLYIEKTISSMAVWNYLVSRFSRIAPAYLLIILLSYVIYVYVDRSFPYEITADNIFRHLLFSGSVSVFWSVPPEVQFYLLFPLIWLAAYQCRSRASVVGLVIVAMVSLITLSYRDVLPGTFVGSKLHFFLFGAIAGVVRRHIKADAQNVQAMAIIHAVYLALIIAAVAGVLNVHLFSKDEFYTKLIAAYFSALFVFVFSIRSPVASKLFENRVMTKLGDWSFSLYLLHLPVIYLVTQLVAPPQSSPMLLMMTAATIGLVAWLNFTLVELPGARFVKYCGQRIARPGAPFFSQKSG